MAELHGCGLGYWPQIIRSFGYALIATVCALLISYPLAYFIGVKVRRFPLLQNLLMTLVIAPFFISFLLRTLAWKQLLRRLVVHHVAEDALDTSRRMPTSPVRRSR